MAGTPRAAGMAMPAEWTRHAATWLAWPKREADWPGKLAAIPWVYADVARRLSATERVCILVDDDAMRRDAATVLARVAVPQGAIELAVVPTDRTWVRDNGPIFLTCADETALRAGTPRRALARFGFNGWAMYPEHTLDAQVPNALAKHTGLPMFDAIVGGRRVVLEGGAIDVNGEGALLSTELCLLDQTSQVRNPGMTRAEIEAVLAEYLGAPQVIWLPNGIDGDETHGHVDTVCRFVSRSTVVACREANAADPNHRLLEENWERLVGSRLADGTHLETIALPMPEPIGYDGTRLPATYANFYIANELVLVPTYNDPNDSAALGILKELLPDRRVVGIHSGDFILGGGAIHCSTQQEPA
jgi:agmatine deiminase